MIGNSNYVKYQHVVWKQFFLLHVPSLEKVNLYTELAY